MCQANKKKPNAAINYQGTNFSYFLTASNKIIEAFDVNNSYRVFQEYEFEGNAYSLAMLPDGTLAVGMFSGEIYILNFSFEKDAKATVKTIIKKHSSAVTAITVIPGTNSFLSASNDNTVMVHDITNYDNVNVLQHASAVKDVIVNKSLSLVLSVEEAGKLNFFDLKNSYALLTSVDVGAAEKLNSKIIELDNGDFALNRLNGVVIVREATTNALNFLQ